MLAFHHLGGPRCWARKAAYCLRAEIPAAVASVFASFHLLRPRASAKPFRPFRLIDDVWSDLQGLAQAGGRAPVCNALTYRYQLRPDQLTETRADSFDAVYAAALAILRDTPGAFGAVTPEAARILWRWRAMNRWAERSAQGNPRHLGHYHRHVANYLARRRAGA